jgi:hypothetical protein
VDHDHLGVPGDTFERAADRVLSAGAALDAEHWLRTTVQIVRRCGRQLRRQRDDDVGDGVGVDECVDAALQNRAAGKQGELFRLIGAEAQTASARGDDG